MLLFYGSTAALYLTHRPSKVNKSHEKVIKSSSNGSVLSSAVISNLQNITIPIPDWAEFLSELPEDFVRPFVFLMNFFSFNILHLFGRPECIAEDADIWDRWYIVSFAPLVLIMLGSCAIILSKVARYSASFRITVIAMLTYVLNEGLFASIVKNLIDALECEKDGNEWVLTRLDRSPCTMTLSETGVRWEGVLASILLFSYCVLPIFLVEAFACRQIKMQKKEEHSQTKIHDADSLQKNSSRPKDAAQAFLAHLEKDQSMNSLVGWAFSKYTAKNIYWEIIVVFDKLMTAGAGVPQGKVVATWLRIGTACVIFFFLIIRKPYRGKIVWWKYNVGNSLAIALVFCRVLFLVSSLHIPVTIRAIIQYIAIFLLLILLLFALQSTLRATVEATKFEVDRLESLNLNASDDVSTEVILERALLFPFRLIVSIFAIAVFIFVLPFSLLLDVILFCCSSKGEEETTYYLVDYFHATYVFGIVVALACLHIWSFKAKQRSLAEMLSKLKTKQMFLIMSDEAKKKKKKKEDKRRRELEWGEAKKKKKKKEDKRRRELEWEERREYTKREMKKQTQRETLLQEDRRLQAQRLHDRQISELEEFTMESQIDHRHEDSHRHKHHHHKHRHRHKHHHGHRHHHGHKHQRRSNSDSSLPVDAQGKGRSGGSETLFRDIKPEQRQ